MFRSLFAFVITAVAFSATGAEKVFDFGQAPLGQRPSGFLSVITGKGAAGDWKIVEAEMPSAFAPLSPNAAATSKKRVLAQTSQDETDEHFPLLIYTNEVFGDFTFTTRFKCVSGKVEQMAGVAFRIQDEKNYYIVRASALGNSFRFYKFVDGQRSPPIGPEVPIPVGTWHEMTVTCKGNQIHCLLNGKETIPVLQDQTFARGKIGFWTKSDSVSYFTDAKVTYTPREPYVQTVIRDMMTKYPRLLGLKLYARKNDVLQVVASDDEKALGQQGTAIEQKVLDNEKIYYSKADKEILVTMPVRDRNGDTVGALKIGLKPFPGQTEGNALARATPITQQVSARVQSAKDLWE